MTFSLEHLGSLLVLAVTIQEGNLHTTHHLYVSVRLKKWRARQISHGLKCIPGDVCGQHLPRFLQAVAFGGGLG
jgi:hypothetical protein